MDATFDEDRGRYTLALQRRLAHPPAKVWRALTERALLSQWYPCDVEGRWEVGAPLRFIFLHGEDVGMSDDQLRGEVLAVEPHRLLEFSCATSVIRFELVADGDGCILHLTETLDDPSAGARNAAGWEMCLDNLDLLVEGASLLRFAVSVWRTKFAHYAAVFAAGHGPQEEPAPHQLDRP